MDNPDLHNREQKVCPDCRQVCEGCLAAGLNATIHEQAKLIGQLEAKIKRLKESSPSKEMGDKIRKRDHENAELKKEVERLKSAIRQIQQASSIV